MTPGRRRFATLVLLTLLGAHGVVLVRQREAWPICVYAMYSSLAEASVHSYRLEGIPEAPELGTVRLQAAELLHPFDQSRMRIALRRMSRDPERLRRGVADALRRYEARRRAGLHAGPRLIALRAYETRHVLRPNAENLAFPEHRRLLVEARAPKERAR